MVINRLIILATRDARMPENRWIRGRESWSLRMREVLFVCLMGKRRRDLEKGRSKIRCWGLKSNFHVLILPRMMWGGRRRNSEDYILL